MKTDVKKMMTILLLLWSTGSLFAQYRYCEIVRPDNKKAIVQDIKTCYSYGIEIDDDQLYAFILAKDDPQYEPSLFPPIPEISKNGGVSIFRWEDVPEYSLYQISALNLRTGREIKELTKENQFRFSKEGDLYVFLFSTQDWSDGGKIVKSADYIIIDEKPIFKDGLTGDYPCTCEIKTIQADDGTTIFTDKSRAANRPGFSTLKAFPNPSANEFYLNYELSAPQEVTVLLVDALGQVSRQLKTAVMEWPGQHQMVIKTENLANGWYQCILKTNDSWESIPILKIDKG